MSQRSLRGGYFVSNVADTSYLDAYILPPDYESSGSGFRLATRQLTSANASVANVKPDPLIGPVSTGSLPVALNRDAMTSFSTMSRLSSTASALPSPRISAPASTVQALPPTALQGQLIGSAAHPLEIGRAHV